MESHRKEELRVRVSRQSGLGDPGKDIKLSLPGNYTITQQGVSHEQAWGEDTNLQYKV